MIEAAVWIGVGVVIGIVGLTVFSAAVVVLMCANAPEGYQDESGYHNGTREA